MLPEGHAAPPGARGPSVAEHAAAYASGQALTFPLNLLFDLLIARALGPAMRGQWFLIIAAVTFLANLLSLSIPAYAVYRLGKEPALAAVLNGAVLRYAGMVCAVGAGAALLLSRLSPSFPSLGLVAPQVYVIAGVLVATELYIICSAGLLTGLGRVTMLSRVNVASAVITLVVGAGPLVLFRLSGAGALVTYLLARAMAAAVMARAVGTASRAGGQGSAGLIRDMIRFAAAGQLGNVAVLTYQRVNLFLVGGVSGPQAIGYYSVAESLSTRLQLLVGPLQAAFASRISGASQVAAAARWTAQLVRIAGVLLVCVSTPLVVLANPLLRGLYGAEFAPAAGAFRLLLPAGVLTTVASLVSVFFSGHAGRPMINSAVALATMVISIPVSYLLVRNFGMVGGAWSALISGAVIFGLVYGVFLTRNRLAIRSGLLPERADWDVLRDIAHGISRVRWLRGSRER